MSETTDVPVREGHPDPSPSVLAREAADPFTATDPFAAFAAWLAAAEASEPNDANAMTLATCSAEGMPSARMVLLKGFDRRGFAFYTNFESRKGGELLANPQAALLFHWKSLRRQIRIEGRVEQVTAAEADTYFNTRARISRLGALASDQSRSLPERRLLTDRVAELEQRYPGEEVPRPPHWSGFRVIPGKFEFWQDMPFRLHDRTVFTASEAGSAGDTWTRGKLFP